MQATTTARRTGRKRYTLRRAYQLIVDGERDWTALGNFMNDFFDYSRQKSQRQRLINGAVKEPVQPTPEQHRWAVFCAAAAEHLAHKYGLDVPAWTQEPHLARLSDPWYFSQVALKKPDVRERQERGTPPEFAARNIYCGPRVFANKTEHHLLPPEMRRNVMSFAS
jgi:hypothetical protein